MKDGNWKDNPLLAVIAYRLAFEPVGASRFRQVLEVSEP